MTSGSKGRPRGSVLLMLPMLHQGGFERVAVATARLLSEDFEVALCIFSDRDIHYDVDGLRIINLDLPSRRGRIAKVCNAVRRAARASRVKRDYDLCYSFGSTANLVNVLSGRGNRCRVVTGMRCGTDLEEGMRTVRIVRASALTISCSRELDWLLAQKEIRGRRTSYLYNPLDVENIRAQAAERVVPREADTFQIVTMGRDDRIKAHWHLIKAFSLVVKKQPRARLTIIGAGDYAQYKKLAAKLGVTDRITWTGALRNPFPEIAAADLYVLPSNREGFPNALVEAMALGRPVIAADCRSGPREILLSEEELDGLLKTAPYGISIREPIDGQYGILVPDMSDVINTDPEEIEVGEPLLADGILRMMEDGALRERYGARARLRADAYAPLQYRQRLTELLEGVMDRHVFF